MKKYDFPSMFIVTKSFIVGILLGLIIFGWHPIATADSQKYVNQFELDKNPDKAGKDIKGKKFILYSIKMEENLIIINGKDFVSDNIIRIEDEYGEKIRIKDIPMGSLINIKYSYQTKDDDNRSGLKENYLKKIRIIKKPLKRK